MNEYPHELLCEHRLPSLLCSLHKNHQDFLKSANISKHNHPIKYQGNTIPSIPTNKKEFADYVHDLMTSDKPIIYRYKFDITPLDQNQWQEYKGTYQWNFGTYEYAFKPNTTTTNQKYPQTYSTWQWGTYGKSGKDPLKYKTLPTLTTSHIQAILKTQAHIPLNYLKAFQHILKLRKKRVPSIEETAYYKVYGLT